MVAIIAISSFIAIDGRSLKSCAQLEGGQLKQTLNCIGQQICNIDAKLNCDNAIPIFAKDIPFVITEPGVYCLAEDVVWAPEFNSIIAPPNPNAVQAAITIKSSNVHLHLGSHTLSQFVPANPSQQTPFVVGILIPDADPTNPDPNARSLQSIYITGNDQAVVSNFSMYGIRIFAHTYDIRLSNITIRDCGVLASKAIRPTVYGYEYLPHTVAAFGMAANFGPSFGVGGLVIGESTVLGMGPTFFTDIAPASTFVPNRVNNLVIENVSCLNNFYMGLMEVNATNTTIESCHFDNTFSDDPGRQPNITGPSYFIITAYGANFWNCDGNFGNYNSFVDPCILNMTINNSTFNNTALKGDFTTAPRLIAGPSFPVGGMVMFKGKGVVCNNCQFNGTSNTWAPPSGTTVAYLGASNEDIYFNDCHFDDITSLGNINGFHQSGTGVQTPTKSTRNMTLINCTANNLQNIGDQRVGTLVSQATQVNGFRLAFLKDATFDNCIAQDIIIRGPTTNDFSAPPIAPNGCAGFGITSIADTAVVDATIQNLVFRNCIASRCFTLNGGSSNGWIMVDSPTDVTPNDALKSIVLQNCIASTCQTFTPTLTTAGIVQGTACGFSVLNQAIANPDTIASCPLIFDSCKALHNKGLVTANSNVAGLNPMFSAGFYVWTTTRALFHNCEAEDNIYGIFLYRSDSCTIRNSRSDNNMNLNAAFGPVGTGEGFTDIGNGTPAAPGVSTSTFENNRAFSNGLGTIADGTNGNYNIIYNAVGPVREALLAGQISVGNSYAPTASFPTYYANLHNISTIK